MVREHCKLAQCVDSVMTMVTVTMVNVADSTGSIGPSQSLLFILWPQVTLQAGEIPESNPTIMVSSSQV